MRGLVALLSVVALCNASGFYTLNDLGALRFGINDGSIARQEIRTPDGVVRGTYTYLDGDGQIKSVSYGGESTFEIPREQQVQSQAQAQQYQSQPDQEAVEQLPEPEKADEGGAASSELPQPVPYTPEVAAARAAHFAARDQVIYLQQLTSNQQQLLSQPLIEGPPFYKEYYGAAKPFRGVNPFYYL